MATVQQFEAALSRIDAATTQAAAVIRQLRDDIASSGMTGTDEGNVLGRLEGVAASLEAMAQSPTDPVPVPVEPSPEPNPTPSPEPNPPVV